MRANETRTSRHKNPPRSLRPRLGPHLHRRRLFRVRTHACRGQPLVGLLTRQSGCIPNSGLFPGPEKCLESHDGRRPRRVLYRYGGGGHGGRPARATVGSSWSARVRGEGLGRRQGVCVLTCAAGARRPPTARAKLDHHPKQQLGVSLADPVSGAMAQRERRRRARSQVHALVVLSQLLDAIARAPCPGRGKPGKLFCWAVSNCRKAQGEGRRDRIGAI